MIFSGSFSSYRVCLYIFESCDVLTEIGDSLGFPKAIFGSSRDSVSDFISR